ncbi:hypothetical protein [Treponema sp.]|uniref:hypothetical protein n=1 Tax=Treponema sp. TaxID=166 RepID=UPI00388ED3AF
MRNPIQVVLITSLISILCGLPCYSENSFSRYERSTYTENYLLGKGIEAQKSTIVPEYMGLFPSNITVEIPAVEEEGIQPAEDTIDQVIFSFTQDFFIKDPDFIVSFIEKTRENKLPYACTILLTSDDEKVILETKKEVPCASDYYSDRLYETNNICAFIINDEDFFSSQIETTGAGHISPMWIVRSVQRAFQANQKYVSVQQSILYLSKSDLFKKNRRLAAFNKNEIISTAFPLGHSLSDLNILDVLEKEIITSRKQGGNTLYNVISARTFSIWINESLLAVIYLTFAIIALVTVCFSSFAQNARNIAIFKDLSRTWFLAPAYLLLSALFLTVFQWVFTAARSSPLLYFSLKMIFSLCCLFIVSTIQHYYKFRISLASISFQILILCALNIFIFAFIDLSLMFVFILEYIIALMARKTNRRTISVIVLLMMVALFLQPSTSIFMNIRQDRLSELFTSTYARHLLFSLLLIPIAFQWIRCILLFNLKDRTSGGNKINNILYAIAVSIICPTLLFASFISGTMFIAKKTSKEGNHRIISTQNGTGKELDYFYSTTDNFDLVTHRIDISCGEDRRILRCMVTLSADSNPLYECNFNYTMISTTEAEIEIPDGVEGTLSLIFSADYGVPIHAKMDFYILTDEFNAIHETKELDITGKMSDGKAI